MKTITNARIASIPVFGGRPIHVTISKIIFK
jgi:hypothetical protein